MSYPLSPSNSCVRARYSSVLRASLLVYVLLIPSVGSAQAQPARIGGTRSELEATAANVEQQAQTEQDAKKKANLQHRATLLRERLREGDFQAGDQITLTVRGDTSLSHTFTVQTNRTLTLSGVGSVDLHGVLRAELQERLTREISRYIRNPEVTATSLVQLGVLGDVRNPGFYRIASNTTMSDALMTAGGLGPEADLSIAVVRRGSEEILKAGSLEGVLAQGATLDDAGLRTGDIISITPKKQHSYSTLLQSLAAIAGAAVAVIALTRSR